jgi:hypothetical protein
MRLIACSVVVLKANDGKSVKGLHPGGILAVHLKEVLAHFELPDGHLLGITTDHASSHSLMTLHLQSTLEDSGMEGLHSGTTYHT